MEKEQAKEKPNSERIKLLKNNLAIVQRAYSAGVGLGGRDRQLDDKGNSARTSVKMAIDRAQQKILKAHEQLGLHIHWHVKTGFRCSYLPDKRIDWQVKS